MKILIVVFPYYNNTFFIIYIYSLVDDVYEVDGYYYALFYKQG